MAAARMTARVRVISMTAEPTYGSGWWPIGGPDAMLEGFSIGRSPMKRSLPLDAIDLASAPLFAITMLAEARGLRRRELREMGDLDDATPRSCRPSLRPDRSRWL